MERDTESNRYPDHARHYQFNLGRFASLDALPGTADTPQSWNRYSYAMGNPLRYVDPTGLTPSTVLGCPPQQACVQESVTVTAKDPLEEEKDALTRAIQRRVLERAMGQRQRELNLLLSMTGIARFRTLVGSVGLGIRLYRVFGVDSRGLGQNWITTDPQSIPNFRQQAGLPSQPGILGGPGRYNSGGFVIEGKLIDTTGVSSRRALALHGNPGGLHEINVPIPEAQIQVLRVYGQNPPF